MLLDLMKALGDPTRLRILALLELEELAVGELSRALGMAQSRVSNHLRILREHRLLRERHVGRTTFLQADLGGAPERGPRRACGSTPRPGSPTARAGAPGSAGSRDGTPGGEAREPAASPLAARLWSALAAELRAIPEHTADVERLHRVIAERRAESTEFFDRVAGDWDKIGVDFATGQGRQRVAANLLPRGLVVADLGCGTGYLARGLLGLVAKLVCVDRSQGMLEEARRRLEPAPPGTEIELRAGELTDLPIRDDELDGAVCGMVLHHLADPERALGEMRRAIRPGGAAVVLELEPHREEWMQAALGDRHLGLDPSDVVVAMERQGFEDVRLEAVDDRYRPQRAEGVGPSADETPGNTGRPARGDARSGASGRAASRAAASRAAAARNAASRNGAARSASAEPDRADLPLYLVRGRVPG